jgi:multisubunit Na+/H+ antiporter MnhB subunit
MVYILLAMGVLEAASDRTQNLRGARTALAVGAVLGVALTLAILWFGPIDPFA